MLLASSEYVASKWISIVSLSFGLDFAVQGLVLRVETFSTLNTTSPSSPKSQQVHACIIRTQTPTQNPEPLPKP